MRIKNILLHFKTICVHKYWVAYYCFKFGLYWQGIVHDLSKFSITEFRESVKYYTGTSSPIDECKKENGYSEAWLHHKGRNRHHYEYWQDNFDSGTTHLKIPFKYVLEMICDMLAASRTYNGKGFSYEKTYIWWEESKNKKKAMSEQAKLFITSFLSTLAKKEKDGDKNIFDAFPFFYKNSILTVLENIYEKECIK